MGVHSEATRAGCRSQVRAGGRTVRCCSAEPDRIVRLGIVEPRLSARLAKEADDRQKVNLEEEEQIDAH